MKNLLKALGILALLVITSQMMMADFVNVPASAFGSKDESGNMEITSWGTYLVHETVGEWQYYYAPVYMPDGAIIKSMRLLFVDNDPAAYMEAQLCRNNMFSGAHTIILGVSTSGVAESASIQSQVDSGCVPASNRKVYNNVLQYAIRLRFTAASSVNRVYGVSIEYE